MKGTEKNGAGMVAYTPSVMEILPTADNKYIVKFNYISQPPAPTFVKIIYNVLAEYVNDNIQFSSYMNLIDSKWQNIQEQEAKYIISPNRIPFSDLDIQKQKIFNTYLSEFLNVEAVPYTYYSTSSVEEFFNIQGIQYHPMMYADSTGGIVYNDVIISANNSEYYPHEVAHLYIRKRVPNIDQYFDEGLATFLGGSGNMTYPDYFKIIKDHKDDYDYLSIFKQHIFDNSLWQKDMPTTYVVAAIICDYGIKKMGKDNFLKILDNADRYSVLQQLGIKEAELNSTIKTFLKK